MTVKELRKQKYTVKVEHKRYINNFSTLMTKHEAMSQGFKPLHFSPFGGKTSVTVTTPDNNTSVTGESLCSLKDPFDKKLGLTIALGRALKQLK